MIKFMEVNVNPKKRKTGDCSTRALVGTLGISYDEALKLQFEESLKCYYDPGKSIKKIWVCEDETT